MSTPPRCQNSCRNRLQSRHTHRRVWDLLLRLFLHMLRWYVRVLLRGPGIMSITHGPMLMQLEASRKRLDATSEHQQLASSVFAAESPKYLSPLAPDRLQLPDVLLRPVHVLRILSLLARPRSCRSRSHSWH